MRSGRLRHRVTFQSKSETRDSYGAAVISWTDEFTVWAAVEPLSGREYFAQAQIQDEASVRVVTRYRANITPAWRIKHVLNSVTTYYDIVDVLNHDRVRHMLTIMCRTGVSEDVGSDATISYALLETGDRILLQTGDDLLLE